MDKIQERHERAVGQEFIRWYNAQNGTAYAYHARGGDPPDLVYRSCNQEMLLEITTAYYDDEHAKMTGQSVRRLPDRPESPFEALGADQKLIAFINLILAKKCKKTYPPGCLLVVSIYPDMTAPVDFLSLMPGIIVPMGHRFVEIYVGGLFPMTTGFPGGYLWWAIPPTRQS